MQQTFMEAQQDFSRFADTSEAELLAWLRRMLLNNIANFRRQWLQTAKRQANREVNRNMLAKCHFHLYRVYWDGKRESLQAMKHYVICSLIDPAYCKPVFEPGE